MFVLGFGNFTTLGAFGKLRSLSYWRCWRFTGKTCAFRLHDRLLRFTKQHPSLITFLLTTGHMDHRIPGHLPWDSRETRCTAIRPDAPFHRLYFILSVSDPLDNGGAESDRIRSLCCRLFSLMNTREGAGSGPAKPVGLARVPYYIVQSQ
jgi:hypothetical protein